MQQYREWIENVERHEDGTPVNLYAYDEAKTDWAYDILDAVEESFGDGGQDGFED